MVKYISRSLVMITVTILFDSMSFAQSIYFNYIDGTNASYNLEDVRKITFDADVMNLHLWDGSLYAWNLSTIGNYQYDESSLNVQEWLDNVNIWDVSVFPNPTSSSLNVRFNLPELDEVSIALVDMRGKLILENKLGNRTPGEHQEILDLTGITQGKYMCLISGRHNTITKQIIKH